MNHLALSVDTANKGLPAQKNSQLMNTTLIGDSLNLNCIATQSVGSDIGDVESPESIRQVPKIADLQGFRHDQSAEELARLDHDRQSKIQFLLSTYKNTETQFQGDMLNSANNAAYNTMAAQEFRRASGGFPNRTHVGPISVGVV